MSLVKIAFWPLLIGLTVVNPYRHPEMPLLFGILVHNLGLAFGFFAPSGARAASIGVMTMLFLPLRTPCIALIVLHVLSVRATRVGAGKKAVLQDGHGTGPSTARQLLSRYAGVLVATVLWSVLQTPAFPGSGEQTVPFGSAAWCPVDPRASGGWSHALLYAVLGHLACSFGNTLATQFGMLSREPPLLATTLKPVTPGTHGGITLNGTLASFMGGQIAGWAVWVPLMLEHAECNRQKWEILPQLLLCGTLAGGLGSLMGSFLGALFQRTVYSKGARRVLGGASDPRKKTDADMICGIDVFTNEQVGLISTTFTALALAYFA